MDCSLPGSSIHGIFQARVLKRVTISSSRGSSRPRDQTQVSHIAGRCFTIWATREAHIIPSKEFKLSCLLCNHQFQKEKRKRPFYVTKTKECRENKIKKLSFPPPWEFQTPISFSRTPDPSLLRDPQASYQPASEFTLSRFHAISIKLSMTHFSQN